MIGRRRPMMAVTLLAAMSVAITACGGSSGAPSASALEHRWVLTSYGRASADRPAAARPAEMTMAAGGKLSGDTGCNSFGGTWSVSGDTLRLGEVGMTLRACTDDDVTAQEEAVSRALSATKTVTVDGDRLTIRATDGSATLVFARGD